MQREIILKDTLVLYTLKLSKRAKSVNLTIRATGEFIVSVPKKLPIKKAEIFIFEKQDWILKNLKKTTENPYKLMPKHSVVEQKIYREYARLYVEKKIQKLSESKVFSINKIAIKNQKTQWGSCSHKKNLNFNYKIIFLPSRIAEYVIIHELCHLEELNHSKKFWRLVEDLAPSYRILEKELGEYHLL